MVEFNYSLSQIKLIVLSNSNSRLQVSLLPFQVFVTRIQMHVFILLNSRIRIPEFKYSSSIMQVIVLQYSCILTPQCVYCTNDRLVKISIAKNTEVNYCILFDILHALRNRNTSYQVNEGNIDSPLRVVRGWFNKYELWQKWLCRKVILTTDKTGDRKPIQISSVVTKSRPGTKVCKAKK